MPPSRLLARWRLDARPSRVLTPTNKMIRHLLGVISEFEKASLVAKLAGARRRKRAATGMKVESRMSHAEERPDVVALVKALRRKKLKSGRMSLRAISAELAAQGHVNERPRATSTSAVSRSTTTRSRRCWRGRHEALPIDRQEQVWRRGRRVTVRV
jgi:hypothetical protein